MWAVNRVYKHGNNSDGPNMWYFNTEEEAKEAVIILNSLPQEISNYFTYNEGWEWSGYWHYEKYNPNIVTISDLRLSIEKAEEELADYLNKSV